MEYLEVSLCQIPELNLSCIGCCGTINGSQEEVRIALKKNTQEYEEHLAKNLPLKQFIRRHSRRALRKCGICHNLIINDRGEKVCPAHPSLNNGKDIRKNYCDIGYICKSAFIFNNWNPFKKEKFLNFLKNKVENGMNWYEYSIKMDSGEIIKEFEKSFHTNPKILKQSLKKS